MVILLTGSDIAKKQAFIEEKKGLLESGLWGLNFQSFYPIDLKDEKDVKKAFRSLPMSGRGLVVFQDIDNLKSKVAKAFENELKAIKDLEEGLYDIDYIIEGSGSYGSFSAKVIPLVEESLRFGEIREPENIFDLCRQIVYGKIENAHRKFKALNIDYRTFPQFLGSMRAVIERDRRLSFADKNRWSAILLEIDRKSKFQGLSADEALDFLLLFPRLR